MSTKEVDRITDIAVAAVVRCFGNGTIPSVFKSVLSQEEKDFVRKCCPLDDPEVDPLRPNEVTST